MIDDEASDFAKVVGDFDMSENAAFVHEEHSKPDSNAIHDPEISHKHFDDYMVEELHHLPQVPLQFLDNENSLCLEDESYFADTGAMAKSDARFSTDSAPTIAVQESSRGRKNVGQYPINAAPLYFDDIEVGSFINGQQDVSLSVQPSDDKSIFDQDEISIMARSDTVAHSLNPDEENIPILMSQNNELLKSTHLSAGIFSQPIQEFLELIPLLNKTKGNNIADLFVEVLSTRSHKIPLDKFFILLHQFAARQTIGKTSEAELKAESEEFQLCHLILDAFRKPFILPGHPSAHLMQNKQLYSINRQELLRTSLTIKIIFDTVEGVEESEANIGVPRNSIYKAYFIIWHRLTQKHLKASSSIHSEPKVLTTSQFGKLLKLTHPFLKPKRLGKRGKSAFHYINAKWNDKIINDEMKDLIHLGLPDLDGIFKSKKRDSPTSNSSLYPTNSASNIPTTNLQFRSDLPASILVPRFKKSYYSFIDSSMIYPSNDYFLLPWNSRFGQPPQWANETMQKSIKTLRANSIDVSPLSSFLHDSGITRNLIDEFFRNTLQLLSFLIETSAATEAFLNFYMVVALLLFPIAFSPNKEVTTDLKEYFRESLNNFVTYIEVKVTRTSPCNEKNIMSFAKILRKMATANKVLSACVPTKMVRRIIKIMTNSGQQAADHQKALKEKEAIYEVVCRSVIMSCNALNWEFMDEKFRLSSGYRARFIKRVSDAHMSSISSVYGQISQIPSFMTMEDWEKSTYELPYDIFMRDFDIYNKIFMPEALVLKLPMRLVELMLVNITNEFQTISYHRYGELDLELSRESFKVWWMLSIAVQEYMNIVTEVVALSFHISG